ncbi:uncharacterized protein M2360_004680 [Rhizobium sp. SG_E_25_P2]|uniref:lysozyme inhibitor LprI family protein n=1 Tax=Rhizobium sp. SG_E_25_P2 TaxID=2879942 RepID=UPI0024758EB7|nr:hypothetical protein [Rhizobium sp. SG_E_25_P2]MDH6269253.1 uncharacterized protein [Rhizobium sp. SG_E_25_P2]
MIRVSRNPFHRSFHGAGVTTLGMLAVAVIMVLLPAGASPVLAGSPSFDCAKADGRAEKTICGDRELSQLDHESNRLYAMALKTVEPKRAAAMKADAAGWKRMRNDCWLAQETRGCIIAAYARRIHRLLERHEQIRRVENPLARGPLVLKCRKIDQPVTATLIDSNPRVGAIEWRNAVHIGVAEGDRFVEKSDYGVNGVTFSIRDDAARITLPDGRQIFCLRAR